MDKWILRIQINRTNISKFLVLFTINFNNIQPISIFPLLILSMSLMEGQHTKNKKLNTKSLQKLITIDFQSNHLTDCHIVKTSSLNGFGYREIWYDWWSLAFCHLCRQLRKKFTCLFSIIFIVFEQVFF